MTEEESYIERFERFKALYFADEPAEKCDPLKWKGKKVTLRQAQVKRRRNIKKLKSVVEYHAKNSRWDKLAESQENLYFWMLFNPAQCPDPHADKVQGSDDYKLRNSEELPTGEV